MKYSFDAAISYHAYPDITRTAMKMGQYSSLRVYYLLHDKMLRTQDPQPLTVQSAHERSKLSTTHTSNMSLDQFYAVINKGAGIFWSFEKKNGIRTLMLHPPAEVAKALGLPKPGIMIHRPLGDLLDRRHRAKSCWYVLEYERLKAQLPPSQKRLREATGKSERTQRLYKLQLKDHGVYNYEILALFQRTEDARDAFFFGVKCGWYKPHKHEVKVIHVSVADGSEIKLIGIFRKLPKTYRNQEPPLGTKEMPLVAVKRRGRYTSGFYSRIPGLLPSVVGDWWGSAFSGPGRRRRRYKSCVEPENRPVSSTT